MSFADARHCHTARRRCSAHGTRSRLQCTGPGAIRQTPAVWPPSTPHTFSRHGACQPVMSAAALYQGDAGFANDSSDVAQQQPKQLGAEVNELAAKLDDAGADLDLRKDPDNQLLGEMVFKLRKERAGLDQRLKALEAKLSGNAPWPAASPRPSAKTLEGLMAFATAVLGVDTDADFIMMPKLPYVVPAPVRKSIMVRACYRRIVDLMLETDECAAGTFDDGFGMAVTGTPGIGKSALALYLICCLAQRHQKVVYRYHHYLLKDTLVLLDFTDHNDIKVDRASEVAGDFYRVAEVAKEPSTWLLIDGSAPQPQYSGGPRIIVMTSPDPREYRQFVKGRDAESRWLPVWSLEELEKCRAVLYPTVRPNVVKERYTQFGGVVRYVLEQRDYPFKEQLLWLGGESARCLLNLDVEGTRSHVRYSLVHSQVDDELKFVEYVLGSPKILKAVAAKADYSTHRFMDDLKQSDAGLPGGSRLPCCLRFMLEFYVHSLVPGGWHLDPSTFRRLQPEADQAPAIEPPRFTAQQLSDALAQKWKRKWDDGQDLSMTEGYFQPRSCNHAGYDAFINTKDFTIILQITTDPGRQHNAEGIVSLLDRLLSGKPVCVLFTLPPQVPALLEQLRYQSWAMEERTGTTTIVTRRGKQVENEAVERLVAKPGKLPALFKEVEQWCVPFPVVQSSTASSSTSDRVSTSTTKRGSSTSVSKRGSSSTSKQGSSNTSKQGSSSTSKGSG